MISNDCFPNKNQKPWRFCSKLSDLVHNLICIDNVEMVLEFGSIDFDFTCCKKKSLGLVMYEGAPFPLFRCPVVAIKKSGKCVERTEATKDYAYSN